MKQPLLIAVTAVAALAAQAAPAAAEQLVTSISRHQVMVTSSFSGASIVLFGTVEPDSPSARRRSTGYGVVVTVAGPKQTMVTRRKERVLGIWTNTSSRTFVNVPGYLAVLSNQPFDKITGADTVKRLHLGLENVALPDQISADIGNVLNDPFHVNFIRIKQSHDLYLQKTNGVTLLTPTVFRAEIPLPAEAPVGTYEVNVKVFADNNIVAGGNSAFELVKAGFEQFVASSARDHGVLYGLATAMMSLMTGWFAAVVFRRD
jgi:uncharacterized protein (TIGR02186 family)